MLKHLHVRNYALIERQEIEFKEGFTTLTGETGAGKSILLGALGLVLGQRADIKSVLNKEEKCVVEATFSIENYQLQDFFKSNDLEYDSETIIRRTISSSGKSRAFINDEPVLLNTLQSLGVLLLDIHSQHQTSQILDADYQLDLIDTIAENQTLLAKYQSDYKSYKKNKKRLQELKNLQEKTDESLAYNKHLYNELKELEFKENEQEELENELKTLTATETILENLNTAIFGFSNEEYGIAEQLRNISQQFSKIANLNTVLNQLHERIQSIAIETQDILPELETYLETVESNPERQYYVETRLERIYALQQKHKVNTIKDLLNIQSDLESKLSFLDNSEEEINQLEKDLKAVELHLENRAQELNKTRVLASHKMSKEILGLLSDLGMSKSQFNITFSTSQEFLAKGTDIANILFSANSGVAPQSIVKVASGGERSRLMLAIKYILSTYKALPTLIFDEIDTGVSGNIAYKMALMMEKLGKQIQVLSITHLPQVAAKGKYQYKVYKSENNTKTTSHIKALTNEERITELSKMISGDEISKAAIAQAKELLN